MAPFGPLLTTLRFGTVVVGLLLAVTARGGRSFVVGGVMLLAYALWRSFVPLRTFRGDLRSTWALSAEIVLAVAVVMATDHWASPYVFSLVPPIAAAGFGLGFFGAIRSALLVVAVVGASFQVSTPSASERVTVQWASELLLVALVSAYARRLFVEAEERASRVLEEVGRLTQANTLLSDLNRVALQLPASLDLSETVMSTVQRIKDLLDPDVIAILQWDEATNSWSVAAADGARLASSIAPDALPDGPSRAARSRRTLLVADLESVQGPGLGFRSKVGVYSALVARDQLVGMLAIESHDPARLDEDTVRLVDGLSPQIALALENARLFSRLRTVGADEERTRIARELHDRVGSSLAYLGFELDRIGRGAGDGPLGSELGMLRQDVRRVVGEVRDALYDLRTDVSEQEGIVDTIEAFLARVRSRRALDINFTYERKGRLPLLQEREMWRIAQEAISNSERHARATSIDVHWEFDGVNAVLRVVDDGVGLDSSSAKRLDSYGMLGMRERADAIGAHLEISSREGQGTRVQCVLKLV